MSSTSQLAVAKILAPNKGTSKFQRIFKLRTTTVCSPPELEPLAISARRGAAAPIAPRQKLGAPRRKNAEYARPGRDFLWAHTLKDISINSLHSRLRQIPAGLLRGRGACADRACPGPAGGAAIMKPARGNRGLKRNASGRTYARAPPGAGNPRTRSGYPVEIIGGSRNSSRARAGGATDGPRPLPEVGPPEGEAAAAASHPSYLSCLRYRRRTPPCRRSAGLFAVAIFAWAVIVLLRFARLLVLLVYSLKLKHILN